MVGSWLAAVMLLCSIMLLGITVGGNSPCEGVDPQYQNFTRAFTNYSCLYIRLPQEPKLDWTRAKEECEKLGGSGYPHKWRLVETKTMALHNELSRILLPLMQGMIRGAGSHWGWGWGWAGMVRDQVENNEDEWTWGDPEKWRWLSDNTTLKSFDGQLPWKPPDPNAYPTGNCLMLFVTPPLGWYDARCTNDVWPDLDQVLVCELIDMRTTKTTATVTTSEPTSREAKTAGISIALIIFVLVIIVGVYYAYKRHRKQRFHRLGIRQQSTASMVEANSDQSSTL